MEKNSVFITVVADPDEIRLLKWVALACSKDEYRTALMCVFIRENDIAASDGFRVHKATFPKGYENPFPLGAFRIRGFIGSNIVVLVRYDENRVNMEILTDKFWKVGIGPVNADKVILVFNVNPNFLRDAGNIGVPVSRTEISVQNEIFIRIFPDQCSKMVGKTAEVERLAVIMPIYADGGTTYFKPVENPALPEQQVENVPAPALAQ